MKIAQKSADLYPDRSYSSWPKISPATFYQHGSMLIIEATPTYNGPLETLRIYDLFFHAKFTLNPRNLRPWPAFMTSRDELSPCAFVQEPSHPQGIN
jgi:hypothetical protein